LKKKKKKKGKCILSKQTKSNVTWAGGGTAQVVEHLPSKPEAEFKLQDCS
jgi:hypothetical protein